MQTPFDSTNNLRTAFVAGLEKLLKDEGLGAYILVLANAGFDPVIFRLLRDALEERFEEPLTSFRASLQLDLDAVDHIVAARASDSTMSGAVSDAA